MAVSEDWKYFYSAPDDKEFLFDRRRDPGETVNRAGDADASEAQAQLRELLIAHLREGGETKALDGDGWRVYPKLELPADPNAGINRQGASNPPLPPGYVDEDAAAGGSGGVV